MRPAWSAVCAVTGRFSDVADSSAKIVDGQIGGRAFSVSWLQKRWASWLAEFDISRGKISTLRQQRVRPRLLARA